MGTDKEWKGAAADINNSDPSCPDGPEYRRSPQFIIADEATGTAAGQAVALPTADRRRGGA